MLHPGLGHKSNLKTFEDWMETFEYSLLIELYYIIENLQF